MRNTKPSPKTLLALPLLGAVAISANAGTLSLQATGPTPGGSDVYNLTGATADGANVNDGGSYNNGWLNDGFTYVASDRFNQGQTFTTGGHAGGYYLSSIWIQHAGYTDNTSTGDNNNGTWWRMQGNLGATLRITDPALVGSAGFAINSETYLTPGGTSWEGNWYNSANGDGMWLQFTLSSPVLLDADKAYGFDLTSPNGDFFFEWLGTSSDALSGGSAYQGGTAGQGGGPDNALNPLTGDRVFLAQMTPVPEPGTAAILLLGGIAEIIRRKKRA